MSRLIDAEQTKLMLSELLEVAKKENFTVEDVIDHAFVWIDAQPTAYDIEKVVAELKEKKDEAGIIAGLISTRVGEDEYEEDEYYVGMKHAYGKAIEVVRKGGV